MSESQPQWTFGPKGSAPLQIGGRRSFIALVVFLVVVFVAAIGLSIYEGWQLRRQALGGPNVEAYGFDLSNLNVSRESLASSNMLRDEQPVLDEPSVLTLAEVDEQSDYPLWPVVDDDEPVVGVRIKDESRAYPLRIMRGHEIVNDVVGGEPIAVTYSPVSDSAVVFDRRVGDEVVRFGFSGLVSNSNLVMYDRPEGGEGGEPSLWSQLGMRAISGPLAGESADDAARLTVMPAWIGRWEDWRAMQPQTTVLEAVRERRQAYASGRLEQYYARGEIIFPVDRVPPETERAIMTPLIIQGSEADGWRIREAEAQGRDEPLEPTLRTRWFAWYAIHGDPQGE